MGEFREYIKTEGKTAKPTTDYFIQYFHSSDF